MGPHRKHLYPGWTARVMMTDDILNAARQCLGTPFRHQGRIVGIGLDCAGVAIHVAQQCGLGSVDVAGYSRTPSCGQLEASLDVQPCLDRVMLNERQPGDLLLMRFFQRSAAPGHLRRRHHHPRLRSGWAVLRAPIIRFVGISDRARL
jgi:cell wall-associated NlpC family hydrolase